MCALRGCVTYLQYSTLLIPSVCPKTRGAFGQGSHYLAQPVSDDVRHSRRRKKKHNAWCPYIARRIIPIVKVIIRHKQTRQHRAKPKLPPPPLQRQQWVLLWNCLVRALPITLRDAIIPLVRSWGSPPRAISSTVYLDNHYGDRQKNKTKQNGTLVV